MFHEAGHEPEQDIGVVGFLFKAGIELNEHGSELRAQIVGELLEFGRLAAALMTDKCQVREARVLPAS